MIRPGVINIMLGMRANQILEFARQAPFLPRVSIDLGAGDEARRTYNEFNARHPRMPLFRRKTLGVELLDLRSFGSFEAYLDSVNGKNSAFYFRRRCLKAGYTVRVFDPDLCKSEIHAINVSMPERQGRKMSSEYLVERDSYREVGSWLYLGVFDSAGALAAYLFVHMVGEVAYVGPVLGHGDHLKENVMYLLFTEAVGELLRSSSSCRYFMYDMYFGGREGLRLFKARIGFRPFRVSWTIRGG